MLGALCLCSFSKTLFPVFSTSLEFPSLFFFFKIYLLVFGCGGSLLLYLGFSLVAVSRGYSYCVVQASHCGGFLLLWSTGSRAHGLQ